MTDPVESPNDHSDRMSAKASGSPRGRRSGPRSSSPVLVGRESELGRLLEAATHPPAVVLVDGEAGVGKSRLVRELAREAGGANRRVLLSRCHQLSEPCPLAPVIEALGGIDGWQPPRPVSPLLGVLRPLLPELAKRLPPEPKPSQEARAERPKIFRALRELLEGLGPTVWILEDLHWADQGSLEFLSVLVGAVPDELALVLTYRTETFESSSPLLGLTSTIMSQGVGTTITVDPLSPDDVQALADAMLDTNSASQEFATRLYEWTAGIPFVVEQVVHELRHRNDVSAATLVPAPALDQLPVPRAVRDSVLQRLTSLSADARLMAWAAAVLEGPAEEDLLSDVAGLRPHRGATGLIEALSAGALEEHCNGLYGFRHALATRAVYGAIAGPRRRWLHLRAGRALQRRHKPQPLAQIAHHLKAGGSETWRLYAEAAAKAASAAGKHRVAAELLEDALSVSELPTPTMLRLALALGAAALHCVPPPPSAVGILQRILAESTLPAGVRGELRFSLARLLGRTGDPAGWRRETERAVGELRRRPALGVHAMMHLAQPFWYGEGALDDHLAWLDRAVEVVGEQTDRVARIAVSAQRAAILLSLGDPKGWAAIRDIPSWPRTAEERLSLLRGYHALAETALTLGHYARAESFLVEADRVQDQVGDRSWTVWLAMTHASMDWSCGRWEGLEDRLRRLLDVTAPTPVLSISNQFALGSLLLARGQLAEAQRILASALETARRTASFSQLVNVSARLSRVHLSREDAQAARDVTAMALAAVRGKDVWVLGRVVAREAVEALLACEDRESAREVVAEFAAGLRGLDAPAARASLAWCRGALAEADDRHGQAARYFSRSDDGFSRLPNRYEAARARERRARCLLAGDDGLAGGVLVSALETFRRLGADGDARRVRAQLKGQGLWRGGRTGYGNELSPREAQVARLAGMGQTNREIADALFISPRTAAAHMAASLRKLGLASRHQLGTSGTSPRTKDS